MHTIRRCRSRLLSLVCLFLISSIASVSFAAAPQVDKVEPPNWWIGLPPSPMLLITGNDLESSRVTTTYPGVTIGRVQSQPGGRYVFVWLNVAAGARPGVVPLKVQTASGVATVNFTLRERTNDAARFQGLSPDDVIYLIMPDRFSDGDTANDKPAGGENTFDRNRPKAWHGGDLKGIRERLPYLKQLGVTALWLTPFWKNDWLADDFSYHGYHVTDFYAVDEHLGSMRDVQDLAAAAHQQGIKLVIDYVVNHTGPHHPWAGAPPTATWLHGSPQQHLQPAYDFAPLVDPHALPRDSRHVLEGWFAEKLPDLNPDDPLLATYLLQNAEWWMEAAGADALRLDTFPYSPRRFWSGWHAGLFRAYPHTTTIAEAWSTDPFITSFFAGGRKQFDGIDSGATTVFDFPLFGAIREVVLRGAPARMLVDVLEHDALYPHPELLVTFIGNHDTRRFMSDDNGSPQRLKAAFALLLTMRGIPQIYSGDEIAMPGGDDPDNRRDFPGGFPGDQRNAFTPEGRTGTEQNTLAYVQSLLRLRREHPALRGGRQWHLAADDKFYAFLRESGDDRVLVVFNSSAAPRHIGLQLGDTSLARAREFRPLLGSAPVSAVNGQLEADVPAESIAIYEVR